MDDYLRSLRARGCAPGSIKAARVTLHQLSDHHAPLSLAELSALDIEEWVAYRMSVVAPRTVRSQLVWIIGYYRWAAQAGRLPTDVTAAIRPPKTPRLLPRPITDDRLTEALRAADSRMQAILLLAALAGLRAAEIASLAWSDVLLDGDEPVLRVVGKGSKERIVDISPELAAALRILPTRRGPVIRRGDGAGHMTPNGLSKAANRHLHECGIDDTLHALRHRFGTVVCRIGGIRVAQEALGHASITTTAGYAAIARREIRPAIVAAGRIVTDSRGGLRLVPVAT